MGTSGGSGSFSMIDGGGWGGGVVVPIAQNRHAGL